MNNNENISKVATQGWRIFKPQGLFWRIFLGFWLSSIAIMLATTYVLTGEYESSLRLKNQQQAIEAHAKSIIQKYENGQDISLAAIRRENHNIHGTRSKNKPPRFSIYNNQQQRLFGRLRHDKPRKQIKLIVEGDSGHAYEVISNTPHMPLFIKKTLFRLNSIQLVFILIASTLVSAILSWSISSPLRKLSRFSQQYAKNPGGLKMDSTLINRKDEMGDLASDISHMMEKVESTLGAQKQLLHDVSHELRAPLSRLQVSVALIEQGGHENSHIKRIHTELQNINLLIQQILNFSRLGEQADEEVIINLDTLIAHITENLKTQYPHQAFSISSNTEECAINGYEAALTSALENIIQNACKHADQGTSIEIEIKQQESELIIEVKNYGKNINKDELKKILTPFYRTGNQMHTEGFGLGLSIANKAIQKHNGNLSIDNHSSEGVIARCRIPITKP